MNHPQMQPRREGGKVAKEFLAGLAAIALGSYNLLSEFGVIQWNVEVPRIIGNVVLIIAGLLLWLTAYKLWRYKWHTSRLF